MSATTELAARILLAWWDKRKKSRTRRKHRRSARRKARKGEPLSPEEVAAMPDPKILVSEPAPKYRTSTKSGAAGLVAPPLAALLAFVPFYDQVSAFIVEACAQPKPVDFIAVGVGAWAVTWVSMFVSARLSRTPKNPGAL